MIHKSQIQVCFESMYTTVGKEPFQGFSNSIYTSTQLTNETISQMSVYLEEEIQNYYYKALLSYAESISSICKGHYSWATVKLYYSTFYALRASLACNDYVFIRAGISRNHLLYVKLKYGEKPAKASSTSDHRSTIDLYQKKFPSEWLLSQKIAEDDNDITSYDWLIKRREEVNYKDTVFRDPSPSSMWECICSDLETHSISDVISQLILDPWTLCFQNEYAVLGIPTKRLFLTSKDLLNKGIHFEDSEKKSFLESTITEMDVGVWNSLLCN